MEGFHTIGSVVAYEDGCIAFGFGLFQFRLKRGVKIGLYAQSAQWPRLIVGKEFGEFVEYER